MDLRGEIDGEIAGTKGFATTFHNFSSRAVKAKEIRQAASQHGNHQNSGNDGKGNDQATLFLLGFTAVCAKHKHHSFWLDGKIVA